jgi:esterase/lipase
MLKPIAIAALFVTLGSVTASAQTTAAPAQTAAVPANTRAETVEQRITNLHAALKITPDEETKWNGVAQAMRENAAAWQKVAAERAAQNQPSMTAVDDLKSYTKFAQAHVDGLKNLTTAFAILYDSMPDAQKKVADQVFQSSGRKGAAAQKR